MAYTTVQGEAWDQIALEVYGSEKKMGHLLRANPAYDDQLTLPANVDLETPNLPEQNAPSSPTPPWDK